MSIAKKYPVEWKGGPLDGCKDKVSVLSTLWSGPDPAEPESKRVIYVLHTTGDSGMEYRYDQAKTNEVNDSPPPPESPPTLV